MEKYEAIIKCINDKLKDNENLIEYYTDESIKMKERNLELEEENAALKKRIEFLESRVAERIEEITEER
jgi:hypothetical protein